jgi:hypothetical protein
MGVITDTFPEQSMSWPSLPGISLKVPIGLGVAETSFASNAIIRKPVF